MRPTMPGTLNLHTIDRRRMDGLMTCHFLDLEAVERPFLINFTSTRHCWSLPTSSLHHEEVPTVVGVVKCQSIHILQ